MCQDCLFATQGDYLESLPYPAAAYFFSVKAADLGSSSSYSFLDEAGFACAWLA